MKQRTLKVVFWLYLLILLKVIIFKYPYDTLMEIVSSWRKDVLWEGLQSANFEPFRTIQLYWKYWDMRGINSFGNLVGNVLAFIPFGYLLPRIHRSAQNIFVCMSAALILTFGIEMFQLLSAFGAFDVDDIILNAFGALIGFVIYWIWMHIFNASSHFKKRTV